MILNAQDLALAQKTAGTGASTRDRPLWKRYAFPCDHRKYDQYLCNSASCSNHYCAWNCDWYHLRIGVGGILDTVLMRISDLFLAFPSLFLLLQ